MKRFGFFGAKTKPGDGAVEHRMPDTKVMATSLTAPASGTELEFAVTNNGTESQTFCIFQTLFEDFRADILTVTAADGTAMDYVGVKIKRGPPKERHFVTLAPGETKRATFALESGYRLDGSAPFSVRFNGASEMNGLPDSNTVSVTPA